MPVHPSDGALDPLTPLRPVPSTGEDPTGSLTPREDPGREPSQESSDSIPAGAVFFAGFEPGGEFLSRIRDEPLEYAPGAPGRAIGVTVDRGAGLRTSVEKIRALSPD